MSVDVESRWDEKEKVSKEATCNTDRVLLLSATGHLEHCGDHSKLILHVKIFSFRAGNSAAHL